MEGDSSDFDDTDTKEENFKKKQTLKEETFFFLKNRNFDP